MQPESPSAVEGQGFKKCLEPLAVPYKLMKLDLRPSKPLGVP